ncbi:probable protein phosphatase 2C 6 [Andrographis paniculata]|uniref:probable protein phosphatase 2C 6 n=1 Tax=Andrographis paniculata TaxID=175694 RepID=UPI0021E908F3|nr:probable protein phosphatase 2C 6 [Andrographis paniculata]
MGGCQSSVNVKAAAATTKKKRSDGKIDRSKSRSNSAGDFAALINKLDSGAEVAAAYLSEMREFHRIPGRLYSNGASRIASLYTQQGRKGVNQDSMLVWENLGRTDRNATFCGVFDGHGPYGHMVARRVRDVLPILLRLQWEIIPQNCHGLEGNGSDENDNSDNDGDEIVPDTHTALKRSILKASELMDDELKSHPRIDCYCSGTTAVVLVMEGRDLITGNVGDSRAVLATRDDNNVLVALQLTEDLKPDLPRETTRIQKCRGRVFAMQDEPDVVRLWLPDSNSPGLAMSRAFGDFCLKDFGLIAIPEVRHHRVTNRDEFVILATDGVWDVLSNQEAVDIVASSSCRTTASRALVDYATRAWRYKYPTSKIDDCAAVCLFLDHTTEVCNFDPPNGTLPKAASSTNDSGEIVPATEEVEKPMQRSASRSLANYIASEDDEWLALDGVTRSNSLISLPRFLPGLRRSTGRRRRK